METTLGAVNMAVSCDKQTNLKRILEFVDEAAGRGVDILVLPEACLQGYADFAFTFGSAEEFAQRRRFMEEAEPPEGPSLQQVAEACRRTGIHVQIGFIESGPSNAMLYNSVALIGKA